MNESSDKGLPGRSLDALLDHAEWLQALARRLARDESTAQDLVQKVWLRTLRRPRRPAQQLSRGWLATLLRNEARMEHRTGGRRRAREIESAEGRATAGAAADAQLTDLEERFELQARVLSAVRELEEPFRTVILLRYFEQRPVPDIARRMDSPVRTVESQLRRAREILRGRLDGHFGDRSTWAALALPLLPIGAVPGPATSGPFTGSTSGTSLLRFTAFTTAAMGTKLIASAVALAAALYFVPRLIVEDAPGAEQKGPGWIADDPLDTTGPQTPPPELVAVASQPGREAEAAEPLPETSDEDAGPGLSTYTIRGVAFDESGQPYPSLSLRLEPPLAGIERVTTTREGDFRFDAKLPEDFRARLVPDSQALVVLAGRSLAKNRIDSHLRGLVVVSQGRTLTGVVRDTSGQPVQNAKLTMALPASFPSRFSDPFWLVDSNTWKATSAGDGRFEFSSAPLLADCPLTVMAEGYEPLLIDRTPLPDELAQSGELDLTLEPLESSRRVAGRVLDGAGAPVEDAWVGLGAAYRTTDADGRFEFQLDRDESAAKGPRRLIAAAAGWCPVTLEPEVDAEGNVLWPAVIELRLTMAALTLEGTVLDAAGAPKSGAAVWIEDPTVIGEGQGRPRTAEQLMGFKGYLWQKFLTDESGRFTIPGVSAREYKVAAIDLATLHLSPSTQVMGGTTDMVLQLDPTIPTQRVAGKIVDRSGQGQAGAEVSLRRIVLLIHVPGARGTTIDYGKSEPILADSEGRFDLGQLPIQPGTELIIRKNGFTQREIMLQDLPRPVDNSEITLYQRCRVRILRGNRLQETPVRARLRNSAGENLRLIVPVENGSAWSTSIQLENGNSPTFEVSDAATEAVLYANGEILTTLPLKLVPGEINEIVP